MEEDFVDRVYEYLKKVGPAHKSQIAKALNCDKGAVVKALEELNRRGKVQYRIPSYYISNTIPVIPYRESDPHVERRAS